MNVQVLLITNKALHVNHLHIADVHPASTIVLFLAQCTGPVIFGSIDTIKNQYERYPTLACHNIQITEKQYTLQFSSRQDNRCKTHQIYTNVTTRSSPPLMSKYYCNTPNFNYLVIRLQQKSCHWKRYRLIESSGQARVHCEFLTVFN